MFFCESLLLLVLKKWGSCLETLRKVLLCDTLSSGYAGWRGGLGFTVGLANMCLAA